MELTEYRKDYLVLDNKKTIEILKNIYVEIQNEIKEIRERLDVGDKKIFELYQPIIDAVLVLSNNENLTIEQRENYFRRAEELASILAIYQDKINKRNERLLLENEKSKRFIIGSLSVVVALPFVIKGVEKIVNLIKKS